MNITQAEFEKYRNALSKLNQKAAEEFAIWTAKNGGVKNIKKKMISEYAYALVQKYGEASATLAAEFYDEVALASGKKIQSAIPADVLTYKEVAKEINIKLNYFESDAEIASVVGKMVKQAGQDTTLKNAKRDSKFAEFAWIPMGDTCAFCLSIASYGWRFATKGNAQGDHADHIHPHCDCIYAIRFDSDTNYEGYDPNKYKEMFADAEGSTEKEKINYIRRRDYSENKDEINEQKRIAYANRQKS